MKKKILNKKGILFWITGLSGSGKTIIGKKIFRFIYKKFGPTIIVSGDDLRNIFNLKKYDHKSRMEYLKYYTNFCKKITDQGINVIMCVVGLSEKIRKNNKKKFSNYIEIYIKSSVDLIKSNKKKKTYKNKKNVWGVDLKAEFPKNPNILITNNFSKSTTALSEDLIKKLKKKYLDE